MKASNDASEFCPICGDAPVILDQDLVDNALSKVSARLDGLLLAQCGSLHLQRVKAKPESTAEAALASWNEAVRSRRVDDFWRHLNSAAAIRINGSDPIVWFEWSVEQRDIPACRCLAINCARGPGLELTITEGELALGHFNGGGEYVVSCRGAEYHFAFYELSQFDDLQLGLPETGGADPQVDLDCLAI